MLKGLVAAEMLWVFMGIWCVNEVLSRADKENGNLLLNLRIHLFSFMALIPLFIELVFFPNTG